MSSDEYGDVFEESAAELAELWRQTLSLGTTQHGGRAYTEWCALYWRAAKALEHYDEVVMNAYAKTDPR